MKFEMIPLVKGILTAYVMTVAVGPGMLLNINASLKRGFIAGLAVVLGLYASDATFVVINYVGVSEFIKNFHHQCVIGIICGASVCIMGLSMIMKKKIIIPIQENDINYRAQAPEPRRLLKEFISGFLINIANPFVFIFWMTLMSVATLNFGFHTHAFYEYFAGVIGTALFLDVVKSYLFSRVKNGLKTKIMTRINHGIGAVFVAVGIIMIYRSVIVLGQPIHL